MSAYATKIGVPLVLANPRSRPSHNRPVAAVDRRALKRWARAGTEPSIGEMLNDPIVVALMRTDGITAEQINAIICEVAPRRMAAERRRREAASRTQEEAERRQVQRQAQKMEALGQLASGIAHDFNNILTVLQGTIEMLSGRQYDDRLQAKVDLALNTIERGNKLTREPLAIARREPLRVPSVDVNALLRGLEELLARTVGSDIEIMMDLATDLWPVVADATELELATRPSRNRRAKSDAKEITPFQDVISLGEL